MGKGLQHLGQQQARLVESDGLGLDLVKEIVLLVRVEAELKFEFFPSVESRSVLLGKFLTFLAMKDPLATLQ